MSDLHESKKQRGNLACGIGDAGPMGRMLVRGEHGHDIIEELYPLPGEPVIDKPGKGSFYATDFEAQLQARGIRSLIVTGVTTEVCVHTTVREANDRGYNCLVLSDCVGSYFPEFRGRAEDDRRAGRHFRLGDRFADVYESGCRTAQLIRRKCYEADVTMPGSLRVTADPYDYAFDMRQRR